MNHRALLIPVQGPVTELEISCLQDLQTAVGGHIEAVGVHQSLCEQGAEQPTTYINEEGKLIGLEVNWRATDVVRTAIGLYDVIVGPMVVSGFNVRNGETCDITPKIERFVRKIEREAGPPAVS